MDIILSQARLACGSMALDKLNSTSVQTILVSSTIIYLMLTTYYMPLAAVINKQQTGKEKIIVDQHSTGAIQTDMWMCPYLNMFKKHLKDYSILQRHLHNTHYMITCPFNMLHQRHEHATAPYTSPLLTPVEAKYILSVTRSHLYY